MDSILQKLDNIEMLLQPTYGGVFDGKRMRELKNQVAQLTFTNETLMRKNKECIQNESQLQHTLSEMKLERTKIERERSEIAKEWDEIYATRKLLHQEIKNSQLSEEDKEKVRQRGPFGPLFDIFLKELEKKEEENRVRDLMHMYGAQR